MRGFHTALAGNSYLMATLLFIFAVYSHSANSIETERETAREIERMASGTAASGIQILVEGPPRDLDLQRSEISYFFLIVPLFN